MSIEYVSKLSRWRDKDTKQFISRARVLVEVERFTTENGIKMNGLAQQLIKGEITISQFQDQGISLIRKAHVTMNALGAGGKNGVTNKHLGTVGNKLRREYSHFNKFTSELNGLSEKQILARANEYGQAARTSFFASEKVSRKIEEYSLGWRSLDPFSKHCASCIQYQTKGFVPIEEIIPTGELCECGRRCRCSVVYRR